MPRHGAWRPGGACRDLRTLVQHRQLLAGMVVRELRGRYRQSVLGVAWSILTPLLRTAVFTLVFSVFARFPSDGVPYPLFALAALLPWGLFTTAVSSGVASLTAQASLVAKLSFPREILPLAAIAASGLEFAIGLAIYAGMFVLYGLPVAWAAALAVPVLLIELGLIVGLTFLLSVANVYYRDVTHALSILFQPWMYLTPVVYPLSMVPERYRTLYCLNPMVGIVDGFRAAAARGQMPDLSVLWYSLLVSAAVLVIGYRVFKAFELDIADLV